MESKSDDGNADYEGIHHQREGHRVLPREFVLPHTNEIPELMNLVDPGITLANIFMNIGFLRYIPDPVIMKIADQSKYIFEQFSDSRRRLYKQAAFIELNSAISANSTLKTKNRKRNNSMGKNNKMDKRRKIENSSSERKTEKVREFDSALVNEVAESLKEGNGHFSDFVLFFNEFEEEESPECILKASAHLNNQKLKWSERLIEGRKFIYRLLLNGQLVACETGKSKDISLIKRSVYQTALGKLKQCCYAIKMREKILSDMNVDASVLELESGAGEEAKQGAEISILSHVPEKEIGQTEELAKPAGVPTEESSSSRLEKELGSGNIGLKMMKSMGWEGGGLGKNQQGIEEPIKPPILAHRQGLGATIEKENKIASNHSQLTKWERKMLKERRRADRRATLSLLKKNAKSYLKKWLEANESQNLVFSSKFADPERRVIHHAARELSLITKTCTKKDSRYLVVFKLSSPWEIVKKLKASGGSSDKYELIHPSKV